MGAPSAPARGASRRDARGAGRGGGLEGLDRELGVVGLAREDGGGGGEKDDEQQGRREESLSVTVSALPPEWIDPARIRRFFKRPATRQVTGSTSSTLVSLSSSSSSSSYSLSTSSNLKAPEQQLWWWERWWRRWRASAIREMATTVKSTSFEGVASEASNFSAKNSTERSWGNESDEAALLFLRRSRRRNRRRRRRRSRRLRAAGFHFLNSVNVLPLSATICEVKVEAVASSEEVYFSRA